MDIDRFVYRSRIRGCFLGGAVGDALGAPVEFWDAQRILDVCGPDGVTAFLPHSIDGEERYGLITDDTQMTLFAAEGIIRAAVRMDRGIGFNVSLTHHAFDRWLDTQLLDEPSGWHRGWLRTERWLYSRRAPGKTCMTALLDTRNGRLGARFGDAASNDSKGCGAVMRSAPFGLMAPVFSGGLDWVFKAACESASYTHGHPTGQRAAGALAVLIGSLAKGQSLTQASATALSYLGEDDETAEAMRRAISASELPPSVEAVESLGGGWVAEEALAIALYAAFVYPGRDDVLKALALAVTHSGDSDSTGAICGNILGALHGEDALPPELVFEVEGRGTILQLVDDFSLEMTAGGRLHGDWGPYTRWRNRYPGG